MKEDYDDFDTQAYQAFDDIDDDDDDFDEEDFEDFEGFCDDFDVDDEELMAAIDIASELDAYDLIADEFDGESDFDVMDAFDDYSLWGKLKSFGRKLRGKKGKKTRKKRKIRQPMTRVRRKLLRVPGLFLLDRVKEPLKPRSSLKHRVFSLRELSPGL
jgi:hypothetical protein